MENKITERQDIFQYAKDTFGTEPEYLWRSHPNNAILRNADNEKWYAIIMDVPKNKIGLEGEERIDVLNVKCDPVMIGSLLMNDGYLPTYHMHKGRWISIILNGTVPSDEIFWLLNISYEIISKEAKNSTSKQSRRKKPFDRYR